MRKTGLRWLWVAVLVLIVDRITKIAAQTYLTAYVPKKIMPSFNLTLAYNKGAAFSFLHSASGWQVDFLTLLAVIVVIALLIWMKRMSEREAPTAIAFSMIIGGALGNAWDRIMYGHVIDFVQWYLGSFYWPTFNVADSAICVGAAVLIVESIFRKKA